MRIFIPTVGEPPLKPTEEAPGSACLTCQHCGGRAFSLTWTWASEGHLTALMLCHPGIGLEYEDASIACSGCGHVFTGNEDDRPEIIRE